MHLKDLRKLERSELMQSTLTLNMRPNGEQHEQSRRTDRDGR